MILIVVAAICLASIYLYLRRNATYWETRGVNGPKPTLFFGNFLDMFKMPVNVLEMERYKKYGRIYGHMEMSQPVITVGEPELIKQICIKDFEVFVNRQSVFPSDVLLSKMILNLKDNDWKRVRSIVSPSFSSAKIRKMYEFTEQCADNTLQYIEKVASESKEVDLKIVLTAYTTDVISRGAFGMETNGFKDPNNEFLKTLRDVGNLRGIRVLMGALFPESLQKTLGLQVVPNSVITYLTRVMKAILNERKQNKIVNHNDFVKLLIDAELKENNEIGDESNAYFYAETEQDVDERKNAMKVQSGKRKLDEDEVLAQSIQFFVGGFETTSIFLNYAAYALAMHTDIQEKLFKELNDYYTNKEVNYDSLMQLPYLDAFVNETLRFYSPVVNFDRVASRDYKLGETGIVIPKGTIVNLPFFALHHDEEYFPDPELFKPERFLPENRKFIKPNTFIPFGIGPRFCIGMRFALLSSKVMLAKLVNRFRIVKTEKTVSQPVYNGSKILLLCEPLIVRFEQR